MRLNFCLFVIYHDVLNNNKQICYLQIVGNWDDNSDAHDCTFLYFDNEGKLFHSFIIKDNSVYESAKNDGYLKYIASLEYLRYSNKNLSLLLQLLKYIEPLDVVRALIHEDYIRYVDSSDSEWGRTDLLRVYNVIEKLGT